MPRLAANLTLLFAEVPFLDRFQAAADAGFRGVECQFPYDYEPLVLAEQLARHDLAHVLYNLPAGDWASGERGIACHPGRSPEFQAGVEQALRYSDALHCQQVNCLAGIVPPGVSKGEAWEAFIGNLRFAAERLGRAGIKLLIEAINTRDVPGFFLSGIDEASALIDTVGSDNLFCQYDVYHRHVMNGDVGAEIRRHRGTIAHIQIADNPGRHEPGTGDIDFVRLFRDLDEAGYAGWVGCEYHPLTETNAGLEWARPYLQASSTRGAP